MEMQKRKKGSDRQLRKVLASWIFLLCTVLISCDQMNSYSSKNNQSVTIAQVGKSRLSESDIESVFGSGFSREDSMRATNKYIRRWVQEELMKKEAEKTLQERSEIQRMVEEYRKSLIIHQFEQELAREKLDSTITKTEISEQYQKNKASFILSEPIYSIRWIIISNSNISAEELEHHWANNKVQTDEKWVKLAELYANNYNLDPQVWWRQSELLSLLPIEDKNLLGQKAKMIRKTLEDDDILLVDIIEAKEQGKLAPMAFVEEDIKSYILHQRKEAFLRDFREKLYEKAVNSNAVKINLK
jgi:hypothetical protein